MDEAIEVVSRTCAYTNHTILAEALETWPLKYLEKVVPQLVPYIKELDKRIRAKVKDPAVQIIDKDKKVHMAFIDIHYGLMPSRLQQSHHVHTAVPWILHIRLIFPRKEAINEPITKLFKRSSERKPNTRISARNVSDTCSDHVSHQWLQYGTCCHICACDVEYVHITSEEFYFR